MGHLRLLTKLVSYLSLLRYTDLQLHITSGTDEGLEDVVPEVNVGLTNHKTFHGVHLQNGYIYYATVKGKIEK